MALSLVGVNAVATASIQRKLRNLVYGKSALLSRIAQRRGFRDFTGLTINEPIAFKRLPAGAIARGGTVPADYSDPETTFVTAPKLYFADVPLLAFDGLRNDGPESALSLAEMRMAEANAALGEILGASMYFSGQNLAAVGADYFASFPTGGFFSFINTTTFDTTSVFVDGLSQWLDDGNQVTTVGTLSRTDIGPAAGTVGGANSYVASVNPILLTSINTAIGKTWFQPQRTDVAAMDPNTFMFLINKIQPLIRFGSEDSSMANIGFQAVRHAGVEYVADNLCPPGAVFGFDSTLLHLWVSKRELGRFGFTGFKTDQTTVGDVLGQIVFFGNLSYGSPRVGFRLYAASS